ncbi:hypothetical protein AD951_13475 [Acetobacter malorum]|uniref:Uncharacterized protein n=1 Tax=Acetobacter malorum TaxID=178901 RepID=A0A149UJA9_9PROT|nr:hypothetical protein AD951_13475 [Acetobacter malorum]
MAEGMTITAIAPLTAAMMSITAMAPAHAGAMPTGAPARSPVVAAPAWRHAPVADRAAAVCLARPARVVAAGVRAVGDTDPEAVVVPVGAVMGGMEAPVVAENPEVRAAETE